MSPILPWLTPWLILSILQSLAAAAPTLKVGLPMSSFASDSASDAKIATEVFLREPFAASQIAFDGKVFSNDPNLVAAIKVDKVDLFVINSAFYLEVADDLEIHPVLVSTCENKPVENLVLVTRKGLELGDLQGASLLIDHSARGKTPLRWISDHLLRSGTGKTATEFFSRIEEVNAASKAVLPVYFGKSDAVVLSSGDYGRLCEHNPSIRSRLQIIGRSKPLARQLVCLRNNLQGHTPSQITDLLESLHRSPGGLRFLEKIGTTRLVAFREDYLLYNREIHNRTESARSAKGGER